MRTDMILLASGAVALAFYFAGQITPAAVAAAIGAAVLAWSVTMNR